MILISHRGNINGKNENLENRPTYIDKAINKGFDVEVDVWYVNVEKNWDWFLGHDFPQYKISIDWIINRSNNLWVHCKNTESLVFFKNFNLDINYFWHEKDTVTLTSKNYIWAYPGKQPIKNSIAVMPEIYSDKIENCLGVCSDFIQIYLK